MKKLALALTAIALSTGFSLSAHATSVYTASASGDITAYFISSSAADTDLVGINVNGVDKAGWQLSNQSSSVGQSYNFGHVNAGDVITFKLLDKSVPNTWYSDPSLNTDKANHVQISDWSAASLNNVQIPKGTLVAFEDRAVPGADLDYNDAKYVFTNVSTVPIPGAVWLFGSALFGFLGIGRRNRPATVAA